MFNNENDLDGLQNMRFKVIIINFIKDFKEVKEDPKKQLSKIKEKEHKENKHMDHTQNNTNIRLMELTKTNQDFRMEINQERETLKRTQVEIKMELRNPIAQQ